MEKGDKIGEWTIIEPFRNIKSRKLMYKVKCSCGIEKEVGAHALKNGLSKGCQPCSRKSMIQRKRDNFPKVGDKKGDWTILDIIIPDEGKTKVEIKCKCGYVKQTEIGNLLGTNSCRKCKGLKTKGLPLYRCRTGIGELSGNYWCAIKRGALSRGYEFSITLEEAWYLFIWQEEKCNLSGLPLKLGYKKIGEEQTASLDRIDSKKGYISGNIQWVHKDINRIKQNLPQDYFIELCKLVTEKFN